MSHYVFPLIYVGYVWIMDRRVKVVRPSEKRLESMKFLPSPLVLLFFFINNKKKYKQRIYIFINQSMYTSSYVIHFLWFYFESKLPFHFIEDLINFSFDKSKQVCINYFIINNTFLPSCLQKNKFLFILKINKMHFVFIKI